MAVINIFKKMSKEKLDVYNKASVSSRRMNPHIEQLDIVKRVPSPWILIDAKGKSLNNILNEVMGLLGKKNKKLNTNNCVVVINANENSDIMKRMLINKKVNKTILDNGIEQYFRNEIKTIASKIEFDYKKLNRLKVFKFDNVNIEQLNYIYRFCLKDDNTKVVSVSVSEKVGCGTVKNLKWFNDDNGYGILENSKGEDVFVHFLKDSNGRKNKVTSLTDKEAGVTLPFVGTVDIEKNINKNN